MPGLYAEMSAMFERINTELLVSTRFSKKKSLHKKKAPKILQKKILQKFSKTKNTNHIGEDQKKSLQSSIWEFWSEGGGKLLSEDQSLKKKVFVD